MRYQHFSILEREKLQDGLWAKRSIRAIAEELGRNPSSVSREIRKNKPPHFERYTPRLAHERALIHRSHRGRTKRLKSAAIRRYVTEKLRTGYSPEQIAGRIRIDCNKSISHEAIYQYIYAQVHRGGRGSVRPGNVDLRPYLKRRHKARAKLGMRKGARIYRPRGPSIDTRPKEVERRRTPGHWEGDSVVSKKSKVGLNTLVERKTGMVFISRVLNGTAHETTTRVCHRLRALPPHLRKTLTLDNGSENAGYRTVTATLGMRVYYAHPYHSWERGTNENTNGLIRWYFPKGTDFATITDEAIAYVEEALNNRPRKRLGWRTPLEAWSVALQS